MNPHPSLPPHALPVVDAEDTSCHYSVEIIAELTGVEPRTVLHYQQQGLIRPSVQEGGADAAFDTEGLRQLRRIEHLRANFGMNDAGLKLVIHLLHEVERLRQERRWIPR